MSAAEALLARIVDYAGLFPPAGLSMETAVRNYQQYLAGDHAWMLGNFVVPASRLTEFVEAFERVCCGEQEQPWTLSIVCAGELADDGRILEEFQQGAVFLASIETKADDARSAALALDTLPQPAARYVEFPPERAGEVLPVLADRGARAKIRTGGLTPETIPSPQAVAHFLAACARERVPFKATAGLHFPVRAEHPLSPAPGSPSAAMHGFLNIFLAAALAWYGAAESDILRLVQETDPGNLQLEGDVVRWGATVLTADHLDPVRRDFAIGFGSCSFTEPIDSLRQIGWI